MTAMKKNIIFGIAGALALFSFTACNPELLNIPQKGVIAYEDFYQTDEDAQSALTALYAEFVSIFNAQGSNNPAWNVVVNATGDELYWGGGKKNGSSSGGQEMNEFRNTYDSTIPHIRVVYKGLYSIIYKANLVLDNFYGENGELCDSPVKKKCVAEARVLRAWAHFTAACYWGTPPLVEHVLAGDARPTNCDHQVLMDWCIAEFKKALEEGLDARNGKNDKAGAYKVTSGACLAFLGKAQIFNKDWAGAKASLKQVIDSGNYALAPTSDLLNLFHKAGDGNEEKILEGNHVYNEAFGGYGDGKFHFQRNQALFFRNIKKYPSVLLQAGDGWGNNVSPTKKFMDAIMAHEPNSARRKAWFASYEEFLTEYEYPLDASEVSVPDENGTKTKKKFKADKDMTKEEKLMDFRRGLNCEKYDETYANYGYYFMKLVPWNSDLIPNNKTVTEENRIVMRYAEVLLLYAEACAMTGDNDGLKYLNMVAERAGAPTYSSLTMENVKQEKWFELCWEGTRFLDLVRWGDAAKELAFKSHDETPYLGDEFYVKGSMGKKTTGKPHKARISFIDDGWAASGGGFKPGKHELYPFPFDVVQLNPWDEEKGVGLKQNPGWD